jgi:hypothetical protein
MGSPLLGDLDGFSRLARVPGDLVVHGAGGLGSLSALSGVTSVGLSCVVRCCCWWC